MINVTDSLQIDSLKSIVEICRGQQDSLNSIIKANTSVLDINTANNKFALDSLTNHIQICQSQIDSIYAHGDPLHHLSSVFHKLKDWLPSNILDMFQMDNFNKIVTLLAVGIFLFVAIKYHFLKKNPGRYKEKRNEWDEHFMCKPKNRNGKKKDDEIEVPTVWDIFCSLIKFIIKILKGVIRFFKELPERLIFFLSKIKEYLKNTIKFDREILSEDGHSLVRFSLNLAVLFPIVIMLLVIPLGLVWQLLHGGKYSIALGIYDETHACETNVLWSIISQYLDPGNLANSNGLGSVIAFVLATAGIVCLSGLLVSSIVNWISQRRERWQKGLITYEKVKDFNKYVVIIGINEQTASIARRALDSDDNRYVLIQTRQDVEKVRPELESKIDDDKQDRIVYYAGDRTSYEDIKKLHLEKAIEVFILGESVENTDKKNNEDQQEKEHDAYNISCLEHISKYIKDYREEAKKKLEEANKNLEEANKKLEKANKNLKEAEKVVTKCEKEVTKCEAEYKEVYNKARLNIHVQFDYQSTFTAFKATHLYQKLGRDIRFIPFNIHELWAKKVLVDNLAIYPAGNKTELKVQRYYPIDTYTYVDKNGHDKRKGITLECHKTVHLVIIGMNQMGTALATQAALLCHFPNFAKSKSKKTIITFIDDNAIREAEYYMGRYSTLFELSHYRIVKLNGDEANSNEFNWKTTDPFKTGKYNHLITTDDKEIITVKKDDKEETIENPCLLDVKWEFIQGNAASKPVQNYIKELVVNNNGKETDKTVTIAICFNDSQQSLASAMYLPKTVYDNCNQVLVYQRSIFDVANDVARGDSDWRRYQNLFPFGMSEASYTENPFDSHLAALDYYMYENEKRFEQVKNYFDETKEYADEQNKHEFETSILKSVDDAWENAGIVRKTASIDSVDSIPFKLRSMGIEYCRDLDKIKEKISKEEYKEIKDGIVEAEHNRWMMQRLVSGYRPFTKDEQKYFEDLRTLIKEVRNNIKLENSVFIHKLNELRDVFLKEINNEKEKKSRKEEFDRIINDVVKIKSDEKKVNDLLNRIGRVIEHRIDEIKDEERASYCICSSERMKKIAKGMISNDESVIESIPILLRGQELLNVLILRSQDNRYENSQHKKALKEIFDGNFLPIEGKKEEGKKDEDKDKVFCEHAFWMADTAVSNKQWHYVTGKKVIDYEEKKELPVVNVSWHDVQDFLDILRKKSGLYFDLPSQKEWRTAADNGEQNKETWNVRTEESGEISEPVEVRIKEKSGVLHHFFGNVWEWSRSHDEQKLKKFMGGSFRFRERECQPDEDEKKDKTNHYWWHSWDADSKSDDLGFRLVWKYDRDVPTLNGNVNTSSSKESDNALSPEQNAIIEWFKKDKHELKLIEPGFFVMGAEEEKKEEKEKEKKPNQDKRTKPDANEGPRHTVHISESFYICQVPVTQSLWNAVMDVKKPRLNKTENRIGDEIPQTDISWKDVCDFIETLNKEKKIILPQIITNLAETEKSYEFRLPTEAEWEYAAKSAMSFFNVEEKDFINKEGRYYSVPVEEDNDGNLLTNDNELYMRRKDVKYPLFAAKSGEKGLDPINFEGLDPTNFAWFSQPSIHEVAQKEPNELDLYDMSGNIWEWCHDYYIADMYDACKIGENENIQNTFIKHEYQNKGYITDPVAMDPEYSAHVFRGGSWRSSKWDCRCTRANYWGENYKANDLGFRLVLGRPISELGKAEKDKEYTTTPAQS